MIKEVQHVRFVDTYFRECCWESLHKTVFRYRNKYSHSWCPRHGVILFVCAILNNLLGKSRWLTTTGSINLFSRIVKTLSLTNIAFGASAMFPGKHARTRNPLFKASYGRNWLLFQVCVFFCCRNSYLAIHCHLLAHRSLIAEIGCRHAINRVYCPCQGVIMWRRYFVIWSHLGGCDA